MEMYRFGIILYGYDLNIERSSEICPPGQAAARGTMVCPLLPLTWYFCYLPNPWCLHAPEPSSISQCLHLPPCCLPCPTVVPLPPPLWYLYSLLPPTHACPLHACAPWCLLPHVSAPLLTAPPQACVSPPAPPATPPALSQPGAQSTW